MVDPGLELRVRGEGGVVVLVSQPAFLSSMIFAFVTQTRALGRETQARLVSPLEIP